MQIGRKNMQIRSSLLLFAAVFAAFPVAACAEKNSGEPAAHISETEIRMTPPANGEGIANLPFARGETFRTLDEYLAHLEVGGTIDLPWWREIRPGVYEHMVRMPGAERETATRGELMQRFGFDR